MKRIFLSAGIWMLASMAFAQTNTFPSSGSAGIGTTSPPRIFTINSGATTSRVLLQTTNSGVTIADGAEFAQDTDGNTDVWNYENGFLRFGTYNAERMRITNSGNVGIGTTSPLAKFHINGNGNNLILMGENTGNANTSYMGFYDSGGTRIGFIGDGSSSNSGLYFDADNASNPIILQSGGGNVGIGTVSPQAKLQINGGGNNLILAGVNTGDASTSYMSFYDSGGTRIGFLGDGSSGNSGLYFNTDNNGHPVILQSGGGNVGIGTTTPAEKLSVNGTIRSKEVKVETANWPDYVFDEGYKVETLEKLEGYIKANKHLPGIPPAKEVAKEGISLGEMNAKLLEKIEELTLHVIQLKKELDEVKSTRKRR